MESGKITLITTGGTIASSRGGPMVSGTQLAAEVTRLLPQVQLETVELARVGSSQITFNLLHRLAGTCREAFQHRAQGVVVTHGTDTLEETAYFLDLTVGHGPGPVVVTGAMRDRESASPEGLANLAASCRVALTSHARNYGVLVVMNDRIHTARDVAKAHSWLLDAFVSPVLGPVGLVSGDDVRFHHGPWPREPQPFTSPVQPVELIKLALDCGDRLITEAVTAGVKGLVVEGMGLGHMPEGASVACLRAVEAGIPVVVTSRCLAGGAGSAGCVTSEGFIASDLPGPKARIKLMLALSITSEPHAIARLFASNP
ncbi:MAG: asparaginase [Bacillota bacterium]